MAGPVITIHDLTHSYGDVVALRELDLEIRPGVTGLVGANGAGKTTLLRILLGLLHPDRGRIEVHGHDARSDPIAVRSLVGYMPEDDCIPKDQTAADFVAYTAQLAGVPPDDARRRASETLFLVGLEEERFRYLGDFSTGMKQRVKLAQAIVHGPELVLLDEPASGLDPAGREEMLALIRRLGGFGIDVIVSSHVLTDIEQTCTAVVMLDAGRLVRSGPLVPLHTMRTIAVEVVGDAGTLAARLRAAGVAAEHDGGRLIVTADDEEVFDRILDEAAGAGIGILRMGRAVATLEEEFLDSARHGEPA